MFNRIVRVATISILGLIAPIGMYFLAAFIFSVIPTDPPPTFCKERNIIYVASNGVHLDLIIPRELLTPSLENGLKLPNWVSYTAFGWGDKEFYINTPTWNDLKLHTALRALFADTESAMHVVWLDRVYNQGAPVALCDFQLDRLLQFIEQSFKTLPDGQLIEIAAAGYGDRDKFYQGVGNFNFIQTCNNWVNRSLKTAGIRTSLWSPFDKGVLYQLSKLDDAAPESQDIIF